MTWENIYCCFTDQLCESSTVHTPFCFPGTPRARWAPRKTRLWWLQWDQRRRRSTRALWTWRLPWPPCEYKGNVVVWLACQCNWTKHNVALAPLPRLSQGGPPAAPCPCLHSWWELLFFLSTFFLLFLQLTVLGSNKFLVSVRDSELGRRSVVWCRFLPTVFQDRTISFRILSQITVNGCHNTAKPGSLSLVPRVYWHWGIIWAPGRWSGSPASTKRQICNRNPVIVHSVTSFLGSLQRVLKCSLRTIFANSGYANIFSLSLCILKTLKRSHEQASTPSPPSSRGKLVSLANGFHLHLAAPAHPCLFLVWFSVSVNCVTSSVCRT